jgi:hypothetical protein
MNFLYVTYHRHGLGHAGLGEVVIQEPSGILQDTLNIGRITAVKHANGRDWWVLACTKPTQTDSTECFWGLPDGLSLDGFQDIGSQFGQRTMGRYAFSPDGSKFAYFGVVYQVSKKLEVFDFDRCTGLFSDPIVHRDQ